MSLALLTTLACTRLPTQECVLCNASAVVYGRVTTSGNAPVASASVYAWISNTDCGRLVDAPTAALSTTDAIGYYRVEPEASAGLPNACVTVRVVAPSGSGLRDRVVRGGVVDLSDPADSLRVDVVLTP